jgi:4-carboxymuconolactone decarboxylase
MADWEERKQRASETYRRFVPDADPARVLASLESGLGALGTFAFTAVGEMWDRPQLNRRDRSLMVIAVLAAQARDDELSLHTRIGLQHGLSRTEIEEINLHVAAYAGFPAAMAAQRRMDQAFREAEGVEHIDDREGADHIGDDERLRRAADVRRTLSNDTAEPDPEAGLASLRDFLGDVGEWAMKWAFGEIWSRPQLSRRDRSLVVIAILTALGQEAELAFHIPGGLNHGLERAEIEEIMTHLCLYAGFPRAVDGMRAAKHAFAEIDS